MSTCTSTTQQLRAKAKAIGFHAIGIASAKPFERAAEALSDRLRRNCLSGYGFEPGCESRFTDPNHALPGARSVVSVALSYLYRPTCIDCDDFHPGAFGPKGKISRFAWGLDYHHVLTRRMELLRDWLRTECGTESSICVDTGPLLDRAAAQHAGVGWYGKNCSIITPYHGSWVVLGELVTTAELVPDEPSEVNRCESCQLCVKACPTGAIVEPYRIDASRCISHLTQMKGYAPRDLRRLVGERIYGCDVCQDVCPQNRNASPTDVEDFTIATPPGRRPSLLSLLRISPEEFKRDISGGAMGWIKRTRLRRNAIVALGNSGDPVAVPALVESLEDTEAIIRGHAAWALGEIGFEHISRTAVEKALFSEPDTEAKREMTAALDGGS